MELFRGLPTPFRSAPEIQEEVSRAQAEARIDRDITTNEAREERIEQRALSEEQVKSEFIRRINEIVDGKVQALMGGIEDEDRPAGEPAEPEEPAEPDFFRQMDKKRRLEKHYGGSGVRKWDAQLAGAESKGNLSLLQEAKQKGLKILGKAGIQGGASLVVGGILAGVTGAALGPIAAGIGISVAAGAGARAVYEGYRVARGVERRERNEIEQGTEAVFEETEKMIDEAAQLKLELMRDKDIDAPEIEQHPGYKKLIFQIVDLLYDDTKRRVWVSADPYDVKKKKYNVLREGEVAPTVDGVRVEEINLGESEATLRQTEKKAERTSDIISAIGSMSAVAWKMIAGWNAAHHAGEAAGRAACERLADGKVVRPYDFDKVAKPDGFLAHKLHYVAQRGVEYFNNSSSHWDKIGYSLDAVKAAIMKLEIAKEAVPAAIRGLIAFGSTMAGSLAPIIGRAAKEPGDSVRLEKDKEVVRSQIAGIREMLGGLPGEAGESAGGEGGELDRGLTPEQIQTEFPPGRSIIISGDRGDMGIPSDLSDVERFKIDKYNLDDEGKVVSAVLLPIRMVDGEYEEIPQEVVLDIKFLNDKRVRRGARIEEEPLSSELDEEEPTAAEEEEDEEPTEEILSLEQRLKQYFAIGHDWRINNEPSDRFNIQDANFNDGKYNPSGQGLLRRRDMRNQLATIASAPGADGLAENQIAIEVFEKPDKATKVGDYIINIQDLIKFFTPQGTKKEERASFEEWARKIESGEKTIDYKLLTTEEAPAPSPEENEGDPVSERTISSGPQSLKLEVGQEWDSMLSGPGRRKIVDLRIRGGEAGIVWGKNDGTTEKIEFHEEAEWIDYLMEETADGWTRIETKAISAERNLEVGNILVLDPDRKIGGKIIFSKDLPSGGKEIHFSLCSWPFDIMSSTDLEIFRISSKDNDTWDKVLAEDPGAMAAFQKELGLDEIVLPDDSEKSKAPEGEEKTIENLTEKLGLQGFDPNNQYHVDLLTRYGTQLKRHAEEGEDTGSEIRTDVEENIRQELETEFGTSDMFAGKDIPEVISSIDGLLDIIKKKQENNEYILEINPVFAEGVITVTFQSKRMEIKPGNQLAVKGDEGKDQFLEVCAIKYLSPDKARVTFKGSDREFNRSVTREYLSRFFANKVELIL